MTNNLAKLIPRKAPLCYTWRVNGKDIVPFRPANAPQIGAIVEYQGKHCEVYKYLDKGHTCMLKYAGRMIKVHQEDICEI